MPAIPSAPAPGYRPELEAQQVIVAARPSAPTSAADDAATPRWD